MVMVMVMVMVSDDDDDVYGGNACDTEHVSTSGYLWLAGPHVVCQTHAATS